MPSLSSGPDEQAGLAVDHRVDRTGGGRGHGGLAHRRGLEHDIGQALPLGRQHEQVAEREVGPDVVDVVQHTHPHAVIDLLEALE